MTKLTKEQQELLENWETEKWNEIINKINPPNAEAFELRFLVHSLLEAKDAEKADAVEKERERCLKIIKAYYNASPSSHDSMRVMESKVLNPTINDQR